MITVKCTYESDLKLGDLVLIHYPFDTIYGLLSFLNFSDVYTERLVSSLSFQVLKGKNTIR